MKKTHLVPRKYGSQRYFHFRGCVPQDLISVFGGRKEFQISLKNVRNGETLLVSVYLQTLIEELFNDIRMGKKSLSLEEVREILKVEVRKSILHSHQVNLGTNKYDPQKKEDSLTSVSSREEKMKQKLSQDLKTYEGMLDEKLEKILNSLDIEYNNKSVNYRQLRRYFIDLYLLRFDFIRNLINETGRTDDDFRREVEGKLKISLFPELSVIDSRPDNQYVSPNSIHKEESLTPHQSTPLSVGIKNFVEEKVSIRTSSVDEIRHSLSLLIEEWGDIPIGSITREMTTHIKGHIMKLPRNRNKNPLYRDKEFHELIGMKIDDTISVTTINKHIGWFSSFYEWSRLHGYCDINPFRGIQLKFSPYLEHNLSITKNAL